MKNRLQVLKTTIALLILTLVFTQGGLVTAAPTTDVSVSDPGEINEGEQFSINIQVDPGEAIAGIQFDLAFDASLVTVDSVAEGSLLSQDGASTYFSSGTIDNVSGTVSGVAGAITTPGQTVSTTETFAVITMTAGTAGGTSLLTLSNVVVGDINGQSVDISVVNGQVTINQAPVLNSIGARSDNEGDLLTFTISGTDANGDNLTYSASSLPDGASFDAGTMTFTWTPRYDQAGVYSVRFEVTDGQLTDYEDIDITVNQLYEDWDVNEDGSANVLDMVLIGQHWGESGLTGWILADANEDGTVSVLDMIIIGQNWTG